MSGSEWSRCLDVVNITKMLKFVENHWFLMISRISRNLATSRHLDHPEPVSESWQKWKLSFKRFQTLPKRTFPRGKTPLTWSEWCIRDDRPIRFHEFLENCGFWWKSLISLDTYSSAMVGSTSTSCTGYTKKKLKNHENFGDQACTPPETTWKHLASPPTSSPTAPEPIYSCL